MGLLTLIWIVAIIMMAAALLWMTGLIVLRLRHEARAAARRADRGAVERIFIGAMQGRLDVKAAIQPYRSRARLIAETLLDFLSIVRGADQQLVIAALEDAGVDQILRDRIGRGSIAGRLAAVEALGAFPGPQTQFALLAAAERGPQNLRLHALRSLWQAGGEVTVADLLERVRSGRLVASGPFEDLLRLVVEARPDDALAALHEPRLPGAARVMLLSALGGAGAYAAIPVIIDHAAAGHPKVRAAAVGALGKLMHPQAEPTIRRALSDPQWEVRSAAAQAAGDARLGGLVDLLVAGLEDEVWRVRHLAAQALTRFGATGVDRLQAVAASEGQTRGGHAAALALAEAAT